MVGAAVGIVTMQLTFALLRPRLPGEPLLRWEAAHATSFHCIAFLASLELAVLFQDVRRLVSDRLQMMHSLTAATTDAAT